MLSIAALVLTVIAVAAPPQASSAQRLEWVPNPTQTSHGWVADPAHHLAPETVRRIDSTIFALERATSDEIAVVVIDSLDGLEPSQAALLLHRRWGVGKRDRNNGIVFLWSPALRKIYVSVGYRLEGVLPDARVGRIEDEVILPAFRAGNFDAGVLEGVAALAAAAASDSTVARTSVPAYHPPESAPAAPISGTSAARPRSVIGWAIGIALALIALALGLWARARPRRCPNGHGPMLRLDEAADDAKLSREQRLEEQLRSVNYDVWVCRQCPETIVVPHVAWFSPYHKCAHCGRRTSRSTSNMLVVATTASTGLVEVSTHCENCGATDVTRRITPRLPDPATAGASAAGASASGGSFGGSSSGGGSSFGGGSAGGGGAGRSY
jgi:uncharacterized protein